MAQMENGIPNGAGDAPKPPPGVVLPPKDIRAILERTAGYVVRNGAIFEDRIRDRERQNPKFSFLSPNDAYAPYYAWRIKEAKEGRGGITASGATASASPAPAADLTPKGPREPPEFHFSARMPNINALDLDVVRLTALFVAKNGRQFMTSLSQREIGNYQFDFLRPNHSLYSFFSRLVDQYTELLRASGVDGEGGKMQQERIRDIQKNIDNKLNMLDRARQRAEWTKFQVKQKREKEEEEEKEKMEYAQVDWHDFVVVETVLFDEGDEQADLPPPTSLHDLQTASLEQKAFMTSRLIEAGPGPGQQTPIQPYPQQYPQQPSYPQQPQSYPSQPSLPTPPSPSQPPANANAATEEERIRERAEARDRAAQAQAEARGGGGPMRIRNDYVPRAAAQAASRRANKAVCPNCELEIDYNELENHMRIELLDPRWKAQKALSDARSTSSNLSTADVAANLKRLASQRSDVFDEVTGQHLTEEQARSKRQALNDVVQQAQAQGQNANVEEQIRQIHQRFGGQGR